MLAIQDFHLSLIRNPKLPLNASPSLGPLTYLNCRRRMMGVKRKEEILRKNCNYFRPWFNLVKTQKNSHFLWEEVLQKFCTFPDHGLSMQQHNAC